MSRVAVVFTGGTIAMRFDAAAGGPMLALEGAAILARTPGLDAIAEVEAIDWGLLPASHMSFPQLIDLARTVADALARPEIDAAVVVQGTDTIEETSFALDLLLPGPKSVVVVGAMRNAGEEGYDGPVNLRAAVRCAADPELRDQGTVVVMAGRILPARDAIKAHTEAYESFTAPNAGPQGTVDGQRVLLRWRRARRRTLPGIPTAAREPIPLLVAGLATDGWLVRLAGGAGARGFVIAATGAGNTSPDLLEACKEQVAEGRPVVLVSRCLAGGVRPAYGFLGGGVSWERAGPILGGTLSGPKARVALGLGLGAGLEDAGLRAILAE